MRQLTSSNFGYTIAYFLPGFLGMLGMSRYIPLFEDWLAGATDTGEATIGGFLFSTFAALFIGLLFSTIRWLILDPIHHATGIRPAKRNFRLLQNNLDAYKLIEANHYQYYQFYGNSLVAWLVAYGCCRSYFSGQEIVFTDLTSLAISSVLFLGSRDTLKKYYARVGQLLRQTSPIILDGSQSREKSY